MLEIESRIYKENDYVTLEINSMSDDDHVHEDVEVDIIVAHVGVVTNLNEKRKFASKGKKDHAVEDVEEYVEILCENLEIEVKNDRIPHGLQSFNYKLFVGKDVSGIVSNICAPVDITNMMLVGLVGCCSFQACVMDPEACCFVYTFARLEEKGATTLHDM
ncbi:unnamed protein product [Vicia faba]|uniref:Uncharacterized protein n=1 Tax=Vicia faba TaxID=3906 RepID=A0AAV1B074_VICFA|nr:unnamed protein product [Vicia faba]